MSGHVQGFILLLLLFFFCCDKLAVGHSSMGVGGQREEILCPDMGPPWASAPLGPSLFRCGECPFNVSVPGNVS